MITIFHARLNGIRAPSVEKNFKEQTKASIVLEVVLTEEDVRALV